MDLERIFTWMQPFVDAGYAPPPFDAGLARELLVAAGRSQDVHTQLLQRWNGFFALGGLLHVFGACEFPPNHSLRAWNQPDGWRGAFGRLTDGLFFFAEDAFGDQFAYRAGKVARFRALQGGVEALHATLLEWLEAALLDPDRMLHRRTFDDCVERLGPLPPGGHFAQLEPLAAGRTTVDPALAVVVPSRDSMELKAATQMRAVRRASSTRMPKV